MVRTEMSSWSVCCQCSYSSLFRDFSVFLLMPILMNSIIFWVKRYSTKGECHDKELRQLLQNKRRSYRACRTWNGFLISTSSNIQRLNRPPRSSYGLSSVQNRTQEPNLWWWTSINLRLRKCKSSSGQKIHRANRINLEFATISKKLVKRWQEEEEDSAGWIRRKNLLF